jgi:hypothetical protein
MLQKNWFGTLNEALQSEGLLESWDCMSPGILYGETRSYHYDNGAKYGHYVIIYRDYQGLYERPIHYNC